MHWINFEERLNNIRIPDHLGGFSDTFSLATIYSVQMKSIQDIKGYRQDRRRLARLRVAQRLLQVVF